MDTKKKRTAGGTPLYRQIADEIRARIESGEVGPGARLPTELDLAAEKGAARMTIRAAYNALIEDGLVEKRGHPPIAGYFVREIIPRVWKLSDDAGFADPWQHLVAVEGAARTQEMTRIRVNHGRDLLRATTLGDLLNVADDTPIACRSSIRYLDGEPMELADVYVAHERANGTAFLSSAPVDVFTLFGTRPDHCLDRVVFRRNPLPSEAARLELPEATGVAELIRVITLNGERRPGLLVHSVFSAAGAEFSSRT